MIKRKARDKYRNLSEEEKKKKREYGKTRYHNMSEEMKQKLKECQEEYREKARDKNNMFKESNA